jgi:hypothetical protein
MDMKESGIDTSNSGERMKIFDLEQDIMNCWNMVDDVKDAASYIVDSEAFKDLSAEHADKIMNLLLGIQSVYQMRFEKLWNNFEAHCKEHHSLRRKENHDYNEQR